jgi:hypothetical protein
MQDVVGDQSTVGFSGLVFRPPWKLSGTEGREKQMAEVETGGCLCGKVRFSATGPLREVVFCHCAQCRRQSGHHFAATSVPGDRLTLEGAEAIAWFAASDFAKRGFCATCGSLLFWKPHAEDRFAILAGAFDRPEALTPGYHICTKGRPDYYQISDGLPQYPGDGPDLITAAR